MLIYIKNTQQTSNRGKLPQLDKTSIKNLQLVSYLMMKKKTRSFPTKIRKRMPFTSLIFELILEVFTNAVRHKKEIKRYTNCEENDR